MTMYRRRLWEREQPCQETTCQSASQRQENCCQKDTKNRAGRRWRHRSIFGVFLYMLLMINRRERWGNCTCRKYSAKSRGKIRRCSSCTAQKRGRKEVDTSHCSRQNRTNNLDPHSEGRHHIRGVTSDVYRSCCPLSLFPPILTRRRQPKKQRGSHLLLENVTKPC